MPTTRKQKKARKSRGLEIFSDIEKLDKILGERHSEGEESYDSNSARRPESANSNTFGNNGENIYLNHEEMGFSNNAVPGQNSSSGNSGVEINRLSSELNSGLSKEMDKMMNSVNVQIQRAIIDAISTQILPQIQNALRAGSGHTTQNRWRVPAERSEIILKATAVRILKATLEVSLHVIDSLTIIKNKLTTHASYNDALQNYELYLHSRLYNQNNDPNKIAD